MSDAQGDVDVSSLFARPKWWVPAALFWISVAIFIGGTIVSIGEMMGSYDHAAADPERSVFASVLAAVLQFAWYFASNCFWAILVVCICRGIDKLDELVWLAASESDRREILLRRHRAKKSSKGW